MYCLQLEIRPTGGLTFRRLPSAILHISTYPFLPPTTMSGWLRRLLMLSGGHYPETDVKKPDYFAMPADYYLLGAYPTQYTIHTTQRQGVRSFTHNAFSRLLRYNNSKEVYQLHSWEYLLVDKLIGYVLHESAEALETIQKVENYGCKIGKEGYAYLERVSEIKQLTQQKVMADPTVLVPAHDLVGLPSDIYAMYRYQYEAKQPLLQDLTQPEPTKIKGFVPLQVGWPAEPIELEYYTDGEIYLPASWTEVYYG